MQAQAFRSAWVLCLGLLCGAAGVQAQSASNEWHASTPAQKALDAAAFQGVDDIIKREATDVQSVVVVQRGRVLYEYYRDGSPDTLREVQSVVKSALSAVVGIAIGQGRIASIDQPVLALMPEWAALNADPRAAAITVRHLLTMTAGFGVDDPTGTTGGATPPPQAWARPLRNVPGESFAYDNALIPMLTAVVEKATGMSMPDYARQQLLGPLEMAEPTYRRTMQVRTIDIAKLGQLFLQRGAWGGKQIVPEWYAVAATSQQNAGGSPVGLAYGYMWWVVPGAAPRPTFIASGYSGQIIWVNPESEL
ncbi:MAG: putative beta-lactamase, partial [Ramlibacter sp.]|nr:putative beta-lactamase [Ramlibacter sp.]